MKDISSPYSTPWLRPFTHFTVTPPISFHCHAPTPLHCHAPIHPTIMHSLPHSSNMLSVPAPLSHPYPTSLSCPLPHCILCSLLSPLLSPLRIHFAPVIYLPHSFCYTD